MALKKGFQLFHSFLRKKTINDIVTRKTILKETGWAESTFDTYLRKNKLTSFLARLPDGNFQILRDGSSITETDVSGALSQVTPEIMTLYKGEVLKGKNHEYILEQKIGEGAVGHVWAARQKKDNVIVAVKIVNPRPDLLEPAILKNVKKRFSREASNGMKLQHDCLIKYLDEGTHRKQPFSVMEYAEQSLENILKSRNILTIEESIDVIKRCISALKYLHSQKCLHRDIKPANILKYQKGFVLGDLGIVKWSDLNPKFTSAGTLTTASVQLGSWFYMSPEQQNAPHEAVEKSDIYALGVTWYQILTGTTLSPANFAAQSFDKPSINNNVNTMIGKMTLFDVKKRASLKEVEDLLNAT